MLSLRSRFFMLPLLLFMRLPSAFEKSEKRAYRFLRRAPFIRQTDHPSLLGFRRQNRQRKHVPCNDIFLQPVQPVVLFCVSRRCFSVAESMPAMPVILLMPVIQKIIMQKCPSHQCPAVCPQWEPACKPETQVCHIDAVLINRGAAMLLRQLFLL